MADEAYIQLPTDGQGKKTRTRSATVGTDVVHVEVITLADQDGTLITPVVPSDLSTLSTEATQASVLSNLQTINSLIPSLWDSVSCSYSATSSKLTSAVFKNSGSAVSSLAITYNAQGNLSTVTKS